VRLIELEEADGLLREEYDAAVARAGIRAHADDLRAEGAPEELAEHAAHDYRRADLEPRVRAICDLAVALTREPRARCRRRSRARVRGGFVAVRPRP
jgi:hypothetical protein